MKTITPAKYNREERNKDFSVKVCCACIMLLFAFMFCLAYFKGNQQEVKKLNNLYQKLK